MSLFRPLFFTTIWLLALSLVVYISRSPSHFPYSYESESINPQQIPFLWHLSNFDGVHYQNIANRGYITSFQTNFFPLFPLLVHLIGNIFQQNYLVSGILISLISLFGSVVILSKLSKSIQSTLSFLLFPTSFFLIAGYTESLFIFLSLLVWYLYTKRKFGLAAIFGLLLSATRYYGILILVVIFMDYFIKLQKKDRYKLSSYYPLLPLCLFPLGLITYMTYLYYQFGNPLQFRTALAMWNKSEVTFPLQTLFRYLKIFFYVPANTVIFWVAFLEFASFFAGLYFAYLLFKSRRFAFAFYCFIESTLPTFTGTLQSQPRYLLGLFPIFLLPSIMKIDRIILFSLYVIGGILQIILFRLFLSGVFIS